MLHFRRLVRPLIVLSVIATALALIPSTVAAQDIEVFEFSNEDDDADWGVRVTVRSLGGCDPDSGFGNRRYTSTWLDDNDDPGVEVLNLKVCNYVITAEARNEEDSALSGKVCQAELQWGETITDADAQDELRTSDSDRDDSLEVAVRHKGGSNPRCYDTNIVSFRIDPDEVVEDLPRSARDSALEELAERAVEVTEFEVRVRPDDSRVVGTSCDLVLAFRMHGNGRRVEKPLQGIPEGVVCEFRATVFRAPAPFEETESRGVLVSTGDANLAGRINVDLSDQVVLPYARIGHHPGCHRSTTRASSPMTSTAPAGTWMPSRHRWSAVGVQESTGCRAEGRSHAVRGTVYGPLAELCQLRSDRQLPRGRQESQVHRCGRLFGERDDQRRAGQLLGRREADADVDLAEEPAVRTLRFRVRHHL